MLRRHLNFRQISHRFTSSFTNPSFQDLNGSHIIYWNMMIWNPSRFKVEPHSKLLHWTCRPTFTTLLGKRRAISYLMAVPKNRGKCKSATISLHWGDSLSASATVKRKFFMIASEIISRGAATQHRVYPCLLTLSSLPGASNLWSSDGGGRCQYCQTKS